MMIFLPSLTIGIAAGVAAIGLALLVWRMRKMSLRGQFLVLLAIAVSIGFLFMTAVQVESFPPWLAVVLVVLVVLESPFAVRTFMRSLRREDDEQERDESVHERRP